MDRLIVNFYTHDADTGELSPGQDHYCDFVSLINAESFGKPPLIAPGNDKVAEQGDVVIYVNTSLVPAFSIKREDD